MFCLNDTMRYHLCPGRTDMRKGINSLIGVVNVIGNFASSNFGKIKSTEIGKYKPSISPKFVELKMCL